MEINLSDLLNCTLLTNAEVVSGNANSDNVITSVTIVESPRGYQFVKSDELVITSGYFLSHNPDYSLPFIEELCLRKAAGLCIKLSNFHQRELPTEILQYAQNHNFPIIIIPDDLIYQELLEYLMMNILSRQTKETKRLEEVYTDLVESIFSESLDGAAKTLSKWLSAQVLIIFGNQICAQPDSSILDKFPTNVAKWHSKFFQNTTQGKLSCFYYEEDDVYLEWLCSEITIKNKTIGYLLLMKNERRFSKDVCMLMNFASANCRVEMQRILYNMDLIRKYRQTFLLNLINNKYDQHELSFELKRLGFQLPTNGRILLIYFNDKNTPQDNLFLDEYTLPNYEKIIEDVFGTSTINGLVENNLYFIYISVPEKDLKKIIATLIQKMTYYMSQYAFIGGVSTLNSSNNLQEAYQEAILTVNIAKTLPKENKIYYNDDLGFLRLLNFPDLNDNILRYCRDYIAPMQAQGKETYNVLKETITAFIQNSYNYRDTSSKLFLHSNTVRYRISQIEKICNINLKNPEERLNFEIILNLLPLLENDSLI